MEMLCPRCMGALSAHGARATCSLCGTSFDVLFSRSPVGPAALGPPAAAVGPPPPPPAAAAGDPTAAALAGLAAAVSASPGAASVVPATGAMCRHHPSVAAVRICGACSAPICETCAFAFPGGLFLCPTCATRPQTRVSGKRKGRLCWALGLAIWCTLATAGFFVLMAGVSSAEEAESAGALAWLVAGVPSLIGLGVGISCFERRLPNPPIVWVAAIWNGVVTAVWILLIVVGVFAG